MVQLLFLFTTALSDEVTIYIISGAATVCVVAISLAVIVAFAVCACVALAHKRKRYEII